MEFDWPFSLVGSVLHEWKHWTRLERLTTPYAGM